MRTSGQPKAVRLAVLPPVLHWVLFGASITLSSLWKNPQDGRTPRQRLEGIFQRLRAAFLVVFFRLYAGVLIPWLCRLGVRGWWVDELPRLVVPDAQRRAAAAAWLRVCRTTQSG